MMSRFIDRLESFRGLKDVKYIVYRYIHQVKLRKCFRSMFFRMEWNEEKCCWTTRSVGRFLKGRELFNYRPLDKLIWVAYDFFIHTVVHRNDMSLYGAKSVKDKNNNYVPLPKRYKYSNNDINPYKR